VAATGFAQMHARQSTEGNREPIWLHRFAASVAMNFKPADSKRVGFAQSRVVVNTGL
jgi:hypothetical protein